jgi:hypothetical protein
MMFLLHGILLAGHIRLSRLDFTSPVPYISLLFQKVCDTPAYQPTFFVFTFFQPFTVFLYNHIAYRE